MADIRLEFPQSGGTKEFEYITTCTTEISFSKADESVTWYTINHNPSTKRVNVSASTNEVSDVRSATVKTFLDGNECTNKEVSIYQEYVTIDWLGFEAIDNCQFTFISTNHTSIDFTFDPNVTEHSPWTGSVDTETGVTQVVDVPSGGKVYWRSTGTTHNGTVGHFTSSGRFNVFGDIMTLLFNHYFDDLRDISSLSNIFEGVFSGCTNLINAKDLNLSPKILSNNCYMSMFEGCNSLITPPMMSAMTLANNCCYNMFYECSGLTRAPILSASTLVENCYASMFAYCFSLNYVKCLATDISADGTDSWLVDVASSGTFVTPSSTNWLIDDVSGIPEGWTRQAP